MTTAIALPVACVLSDRDQDTLNWHLTGNFYPPLDRSNGVVYAATQAILRAREGDWDAIVCMDRDGDPCTVADIVQDLRLDAMV
jgi:hypothetical protein